MQSKEMEMFKNGILRHGYFKNSRVEVPVFSIRCLLIGNGHFKTLREMGIEVHILQIEAF